MLEQLSPAGFIRAGARLATAGVAVVNQVTRGERADTPRERADLLKKMFSKMCQAHGFGVEVTGAPPTKPCIVVCNHLSYIDPIVLGSVMPCAPVSKAEVMDWPIVGTWGRILGVMFVNRDDPYSGARVLRQSLRLLEQGVSVLNFPEGTTSTGDGVLPFYRGIFGVAQRAGVPVVPVALRFAPRELAWTGDAYFLPHYVTTLRRPHSLARLVFGEPMSPTPGSAAHEFARDVRERMAAMLDHPALAD